jgi:signal transduction histidine kinase
VIPIAGQLTKRWVVARLPPRTIRLRLTALYGGLFLASGAALLAITYVLVARQFNSRFFISAGKPEIVGAVTDSGSGVVLKGGGKVTAPVTTIGPTPEQIVAAAKAQSAAALHQVLINSAVALAIMAVISIWLGWLVAGRALRPLRTITDTARDISARNLNRRLALTGPDDEIKELGNTFDSLLERLEASFEAQRQFVANASHELRTPLTFERALVEVALADPDASAETLRQACEQVLVVGDQQERLIEALLTLSRSQRGLERREPIDLAAVAAEALRTAPKVNDGIVIEASLEPAPTRGDPRLVERLVANLVDNALHHNVRDGRLVLTTKTDAGRAVVTVANTGPLIPANQVGRLFQPFQRLGAERTSANGVGLGLSIVAAIASAHAATLIARPESEGGLFVEVDFPPWSDGPA